MTEPRTKVGPYVMLDAWRGIAALAVVAFHWGEIRRYQSPDLRGGALFTLAGFGYLGVQIFFVISGYVIAGAAMAAVRRSGTVRSFLQARCRRVYPPFWAALALTLAFDYTGYVLARQGRAPLNIYTAHNPFSGPPLFYAANATLLTSYLRQPLMLAVSWTLAYEISFYLIVAFALALLPAARRASLLLTSLHAVTIVTLAWLIIAPQTTFMPFDLWPQFGFGALVFDLTSHPQDRWARWLAGVSAALLIAFVVGRDYPGVMGQPTRLTFSVSAVFALLLIGLHRFDASISGTRFVRALGFCGVFSYSLYLTHTIALRALEQTLRMLHAAALAEGVMFPIAVAFALVAAYCFFRLFERPFLRRKTPRSESAKTPKGSL